MEKQHGAYRVKGVLGVCLAAFVLGGTVTASAQEKFPTRVIRIVTAAPGSNHDWGARLAAHELAPRVGQRVIVENRGSISVEHVAKEAPPDGYTLLFYGAVVWLQPLFSRVNWDPFVDFAPVSLAISAPNVLVVHPSLPVKSVKELIAFARSRPGELNYGAGGAGSTPHIAAELFKHLAKVDIVRVNYKGSGPAQVGLMTGEVQIMFAGLGPIMPHVKSGKARALAVTTAKRTKLTPELPTVAEVLPGYDSSGRDRLLRAAEDAAGSGEPPEQRDRSGVEGRGPGETLQCRRRGGRELAGGIDLVHEDGGRADE
jgi:tripartite-type tricarboxylate transporter receptor subunit TctC